MQIAKDTVVTIDYTLKDNEGKTLDQSEDGKFAYLHGAHNVIPGLEAALVEKQAGDQVSVTIAPADAYGERDLGQIQRVPRSMFPPDVEIEVGMQFNSESPEGQLMVVLVSGIDGDTIIIDGNHPLASQTLHFDVNVISVRVATEEELEHGHAHGQGHEH